MPGNGLINGFELLPIHSSPSEHDLCLICELADLLMSIEEYPIYT